MKLSKQRKAIGHQKLSNTSVDSHAYEEQIDEQRENDAVRRAKLFVEVKPDKEFEDRLLDAYLKFEKVPLNRKEVRKTVFRPTIDLETEVPNNSKPTRISQEEQESAFSRLYEPSKYCHSAFYVRKLDDEPQFLRFKAAETTCSFVGRRPLSPELNSVLRKYPIDLE